MKKPSRTHINELSLVAWLKQNKIDYQPEYRFCPDRRWRFDYALLQQKIAIEVEGGVWISGRHSRGAGMIADMEKYNSATILGWRVLRYTPQELLRAMGDIKCLITKMRDAIIVHPF